MPVKRRCAFCGVTGEPLVPGGLRAGEWQCLDILACTNREAAARTRANPPCSEENPRREAPGHPFELVEEGRLWNVVRCPFCGREEKVSAR